jgi:hypothetical protein
MKKEVKAELVRLCDEYGFEIEGRTGSGHIKLRHRLTYKCVFAPYSPSDFHSMKNLECKMRRVDNAAS